MTVQPVTSVRLLTRLMIGLAFTALTSSASGAAAQQPAAATSDYRLTMPVLRKVAPEFRGQESCARSKTDTRSLSELAETTVAQWAAEVEGCASMKQAAAAQGITTRELARIVQAWMQAIYRMTQEEWAKSRGETLSPLPPGALRENVAMLRQNWAEFEKLWPS